MAILPRHVNKVVVVIGFVVQANGTQLSSSCGLRFINKVYLDLLDKLFVVFAWKQAKLQNVFFLCSLELIYFAKCTCTKNRYTVYLISEFLFDCRYF